MEEAVKGGGRGNCFLISVNNSTIVFFRLQG
jgi:hypothetical protein